MEIEFPQNYPGTPTIRDTIAIPVRVDGKLVQCEISAEALQDHFGARGFDNAGLLDAFNSNRGAIEAKARKALAVTGGGPVLLKSAHF